MSRASHTNQAAPATGSSPKPMLIDGQWVSSSGEPLCVVNPATGTVHYEVCAARAQDVERAVSAATRAAAQPAWVDLAPHERARILHRIGDLILANAEALAGLQMIENGKIWSECVAQAKSAAETFHYFAAACETLGSEVTPSRGNYLSMTVYEPYGVVAAITPWNSPMTMEAQKVAPALAAGNGVVLKPSEITPSAALELGRIALEAGLPRGLLNVLPGTGKEAGSALVEHPGVAMVSFTGGTESGREIAEKAARKLMPVALELGGKSPHIVFADADLEKAADAVAGGIFEGTGQSCVAGSRLFVQRRVLDAVVDAVVHRARALKVDLPDAPGVQMGPIASFAHRDRIERLVEGARAEGAEVLAGAGRPSARRLADGAFYLPTVLAGLDNRAAIVRQEIFGPVLCVLPFDDEEDLIGVQKQFTIGNPNMISYTFFGGAPSTITQYIPSQFSNRTRFDAIYVQDQWTVNRFTVQGGLRYEHAWSWHPEGENGALTGSRFLPNGFVFPRVDGVTGYNDITPRMGVAYDVFGNGKTALKVNYSKYLQPANNESNFIQANPGVTFQNTTTRTWTDNGDRIPQCVLENSAANGECGPWVNLNFGNPFNTTRVNPEIMSGWGNRPFDWQFGVAVQQEILPRLSVDVAFNRRWWSNFYVTDNQALGPSDFDRFTITGPTSVGAPLPTSGQPLTFLKRNGNNPIGATSNYRTFQRDYGDETYYWQGVDFTANSRMANGLVLQGGFSTGAGHRDLCDVWAALPELVTPAAPGTAQQLSACKIDEDWQMNWRGLVTYTIPRIDVLVSGILRSQANTEPLTIETGVATNGVGLAANYTVTPDVLAANGQTPFAPGVANQSVNLLIPSSVFGDRVNSVDMRFGKILRFGRTRANVAMDLYNMFNSNVGTAFNQGFGTNGATWLRPTAVLNPRFARFNVTFDF